MTQLQTIILRTRDAARFNLPKASTSVNCCFTTALSPAKVASRSIREPMIRWTCMFQGVCQHGFDKKKCGRGPAVGALGT